MSHCYTELLDHYCKLMSLESANVNYKPCLPSALLGLRRYWPFIRIRTVFPHKFYSQVARSEWNLIQSYLSIPRVSLLLRELLFTVTLQKKFYLISSQFASWKLSPSTPSWESIHAVPPASSSVTSKSCFLCSVLPWPTLPATSCCSREVPTVPG